MNVNADFSKGKQEPEKANMAFNTAFLFTVFFELLLTAILLLFSDFFLTMFGATNTTYELALQYYKIVAFGCVFQGLTLVFCDFVRVSGKPVVGIFYAQPVSDVLATTLSVALIVKAFKTMSNETV